MQRTNVEKTAQGLEKAAGDLAETLLLVMDKLAGKQSDIKLSFQDLTLDLGPMKTRLNGAIVFDIIYAKEAETTAPS